MLKKWLALATVFLLSVACTNIPKQDYNKVVNREIREITLIEPAAEPHYLVLNLGHVGKYFGLIGALVSEVQLSTKTVAFSKAMKGKGFDLKSEFKLALIAELQAAGYTINIQKLERKKLDFLLKYENLPSGTQALIDPILAAGYYSAAANSEYIPTVRTSIRVVTPDGKQILYQEQINYGLEAKGQKAVTFQADDKYFFDDFDAIMAKPDVALEGLRKGIAIVTKQIAEDLGR